MKTDNILYLSGEIDSANTSDIIHTMLTIDANNASIRTPEIEPIHLHIQSEGGSIPDALALIDVMLSIDTPIYTYCHGYCHSSAFYIYLCGQKRFAYYNSEFLIHNAKATFENFTYDNIINFIDTYKSYDIVLQNLLYEKTDITEEIYNSFNVDITDCILNVEDACKYKIVTDRIFRK